MSVQDKRRELERLRARVLELEQELESPPTSWKPTQYYTAYYLTTGFMLGSVAAISSLLFNVIGAAIFQKHPLELIRVYLTFPMGAQALNYAAVDHWLILVIGCCLYIATGMLYGMLFEWVLTRFVADSSVAIKFVTVSALALAIWVVNFYGILSWLQPLLFGGRWIVDRVDWWVAAATHLVFGWTMLLLSPLGKYVPYRSEMETT